MVTPYRHLVDPEGKLPEISFVVKTTSDFLYFTREKIDIIATAAEGTKIGECDIITSTDRSHFDGIDLKPHWRGKGFGLASYLLAIEKSAEKGVPFENQDCYQSELAKNMWIRLGRLGIAEVIEPFSYWFTHDGIDMYKGKYHVPLL